MTNIDKLIIYYINYCYCQKIGVLPYGLRHISLKDAAPIYVQT